MITKNDIKHIRSLQTAKARREENLFVCEGNKVVAELIASDIKPEAICATETWLERNPDLARELPFAEKVSELQMEQMSGLKTPPGILCVAQTPDMEIDVNEARTSLVVVLDDIHDPGNLGTIIRTADWFGIRNVVCSRNSAEIWSPKTVQASMGSVFRVRAVEDDVAKHLSVPDIPVYGALMQGENIYTETLTKNGIIVIGSESHGIGQDILPYINRPLHIPHGQGSKTESLNASVAAAIIMSEFARR